MADGPWFFEWDLTFAESRCSIRVEYFLVLEVSLERLVVRVQDVDSDGLQLVTLVVCAGVEVDHFVFSCVVLVAEVDEHVVVIHVVVVGDSEASRLQSQSM